jgi:hypothetical protein
MSGFRLDCLLLFEGAPKQKPRRVKLMHRFRWPSRRPQEADAGGAYDWAILPRFTLHYVAFLCIFVVSWCIFAYFWSAVLISFPSKCILVFIISRPNEKLPRTMNSGQRHRQKQPKCDLCVISIKPCVIHHFSHATLHSAPHLIDPIFAFRVSIGVVTKTHRLPIFIALPISSYAFSMQWIEMRRAAAPSYQLSSSLEGTKKHPKWPNNPQSQCVYLHTEKLLTELRNDAITIFNKKQ